MSKAATGQTVDLQAELRDAIVNFNAAYVQELVGNPAIDLNRPVDGSGATYVHLALEKGSAHVLSILLGAGADPNQADQYGTTPLHLCAQQAMVSKFRLLLEAGAYLNAQDIVGDTPLHKAVKKPNSKCAEHLLGYGADSSIRNEDGKTPLDDLSPTHPLYTLVEGNRNPPLLKPGKPMTRNRVLRRNADGLCALDAGATWLRVDEMLKQFDADGVHFSRENLLREGKNGMSHLEWAMHYDAAGQVLQHFFAHGGKFLISDLVENGAPTQLLQTAIEKNVVEHFFTHQAWEKQPASGMRQVYSALPREGKMQVGNYHSLYARLSSEEHHRGR